MSAKDYGPTRTTLDVSSPALAAYDHTQANMALRRAEQFMYAEVCRMAALQSGAGNAPGASEGAPLAQPGGV